MATNNVEIRELTDNGRTIVPVTVAEAVLFNGRPLPEELSNITNLRNDIVSIRESVESIQTLLTQLNQKLNEHTSE